MTYDPGDDPTMTCPWPSICRCTHIGCRAGWIDGTDEAGAEIARPCPNCRPELSEHLRQGRGSISRRRAAVANLQRPSRTRGGPDA